MIFLPSINEQDNPAQEDVAINVFWLVTFICKNIVLLYIASLLCSMALGQGPVIAKSEFLMFGEVPF